MADKQSEQTAQEAESGYELDLDDTISAWDQVVQEAVAAVDGPEGAAESEDSVIDASVEGSSDEDMDEDTMDEDTVDEDESGKGIELVESESSADGDAEAKKLREQLMRTLADFDNFRKRAEREKASMRRYALFDVLKDFLGVHDNLERALAASGSTEDLKQGVEMIARQFFDLMRRHGVEPVEAVGQTFDPMVHEAVMREEGSDIDEPTVTAELQKGYQLHDRLLRPAMVSVKMPAPRPQKSDTGDDPADESSASAGDEPANEEELGEKVAQTT